MSKSYLGKLGEAPVVMLCGPIAYWWDTDTYQHWDLPEHWHYVAWREALNDALVDAGFLVYRPHEAFKGTWNDKMQGINNQVLELSDVIINMTPEDVWSNGTDEEMAECIRQAKQVYHLPPPEKSHFETVLRDFVDHLRKEFDGR